MKTTKKSFHEKNISDPLSPTLCKFFRNSLILHFMTILFSFSDYSSARIRSSQKWIQWLKQTQREHQKTDLSSRREAAWKSRWSLSASQHSDTVHVGSRVWEESQQPKVRNAAAQRQRWLGAHLLGEHDWACWNLRGRRLRNDLRSRSRALEHQQTQHDLGPRGRRVQHVDRRSEHGLSLLRHVEDDLCLAHWRHGLVLHQLLAFWRQQDLVLDPTKLRKKVRETLRCSFSEVGERLPSILATQNDATLSTLVQRLWDSLRHRHSRGWTVHDYFSVRISLRVIIYLPI